MTRLDDHWLRWPLRLIIVLVASEATLRLTSGLLDRAVTWRRSTGSEATIFCVGDSNTQGIGAEEGRSYPAQLQSLLSERNYADRVANQGVAGSKSEQVVQRLARALGGANPRVVIFLAGMNDQGHTDQFYAPLTTPSSPLVDAFQALRIVRVARAACFVLSGDLAHREIGGAEESSVESTKSNQADVARSYEAARAADGQALFEWVSFFWRSENRVWLRKAWGDFTSSSAFAAAEPQLKLPLECYAWEVALLSGEEPAPIGGPMQQGMATQFARYTQLRARLATSGRRAAADQLNGMAASLEKNPFAAFLRLHAAWAPLLDRDYQTAAEILGALAHDLESRSLIQSGGEYERSLQGLYHACGGAAVAHLLARPDSRLDDVTAKLPNVWDRLLRRNDCPDGREWMDAAIILDAARDGTPDGLAKAQARARARYLDGSRTRVLGFLLGPSLPPFEELACTIELDLPRLSWIGPQRCFFNLLPSDALDARLAASLDQLAELANARGFKVVVPTYLDPIVQNERLLRLSRERGFITLDLHAIYPDSELLADNRRRYFSGDRSHPNAAGYALIAKAIFDELVEDGLVQSPAPSRGR